MLNNEPIINKVSNSEIESIDLANFYAHDEDIVSIDFKKYLFMELILKEKDFREQLKVENFSAYQNKYVYINCSADAIIPQWAFMLLVTQLKGIAQQVFFGTKDAARDFFFFHNFSINALPQTYIDKRVVLKGCGEIPISENAYIYATQQLLPYVKSIMYGEPCSTVPIYKRK